MVGDGQGTLQPGGTAPAQLRKRVEREEQGGGVKRSSRRAQGGADLAGVRERRQGQGPDLAWPGANRGRAGDILRGSAPALVAPSW